jgi:hypothetical protein
LADSSFGFNTGSSLTGHLTKDYSLLLTWYPNYIDEFPTALQGISIKWEKCKFTKESKVNVPKNFGVYCFSADINGPFPSETKEHILYIGKASDQYLHERYEDYLSEMNSPRGRTKVVNVLQKYKDQTFFWWCSLASIHVEVVERHLLMCYEPPANDINQSPKKDKHWGKAFDINQD